MTAIVGLENKGKVIMGADAAATTGHYSFTQIATEKVWVSGHYIFGSCGSFRINQLLRYSMNIPQALPHDERDIDEFMVTDFMDAVKQILTEQGMLEDHRNVSTIADDSDFLVGVHGRLYLIALDFSVIRSATGYAATGSGYDLALGALHATGNISPKVAPKTRIQLALEAAAAHNAAVAAPFTILEV